MVQVLEDNRPLSTSERFGRALGGLGQSAGQGFSEMLNQKEEEKKLSKIIGMDVSGLGADYKKILMQQTMKKKEDTQQNFMNAMSTLQRMKDIIGKGSAGTSLGLRVNQFGKFGESGQERAEFEQLGRSLIPLVASGVPIRNRQEFEEYKKIITNPDARTSDLEGAIAGLERLFSQKIQNPAEEESEKSSSKKSKFNPQHPEHKKKRDQLLKQYKNDREKVGEILSREFILS